MANVNNRRKRPKIRLQSNVIAPEVIEKDLIEATPEVIEEPVLEVAPIEEAPAEEIIEETVEEVVLVEEPAIEEEIIEEVVEEEIEEVPLEASEEEMQVALEEEGSLDGTLEEVEELANEVEDATEEAPATEAIEEPKEEVAEDTVDEEPVEAIPEEPVEEPVEVIPELPIEEPVEVVEEVEPIEEAPIEEVKEESSVVETVEEQKEEPIAPATEPVVEAPIEEPAPVEEVAIADAEVEEEEPEEEEEKVEEAPKKDEFKLTAPSNLDDILANICTKRARKLIYRPADVIFSHTTTVLGTDKANDEKIKIKSILDAEIKQGVKLGYLDKFDGLKMSELKEEYENDIVYEYADQEFKRTGILLDGDKVKVYVYDWDLKACHHVGYIDEESAELVKPYIIDREKYSFDINGIIVGGKYKKIIKDEKSGKITVEKGNDGNLGLEIDINIIARKD